MTFIDTFHVVEVFGIGTAIFVDIDTRNEIEHSMRENASTISFDDIYGSEHTLSVAKISGIYSSSPEIRQLYFEHNQGIDAEKKARGDFNEI